MEAGRGIAQRIRVRVAVEDRPLDKRLLRRPQAQAHPGRGARVNGHRHVRRKRRQRAEVAVDEQGRDLRAEKLLVSRELPQADGKPVLRERLLDPQLEKADAVVIVDVAEAPEIAHELVRPAGAVDVVGVGVKRRPLPAEQLGKIDVHAPLDEAIIHRAMPTAAGRVAEHLGGVNQVQREAVVGEPDAPPSEVPQQMVVVARGHGGFGHRRIRQQVAFGFVGRVGLLRGGAGHAGAGAERAHGEQRATRQPQKSRRRMLRARMIGIHFHKGAWVLLSE